MTDVCLVLEGSYPYVAGGVSSWVHDLIKDLPDVTFSVVYLGAHRSSTKKLHYELPRNVVHLQENYLFDYVVEKKFLAKPSKKTYSDFQQLLLKTKKMDPSCFKDWFRIVVDPKTQDLDLYGLVHSIEGWKVLLDFYREEGEETSFLDFFWTWRFLYLPFLSILRAPIPEAKLYHAPSTGYAGILGSLAKLTYDRPLLLTEHGIYTKERRIEIMQADWIYSDTAREIKIMEGKELFREWWLSLFVFFSRVAYQYADKIITLYEGNQRIELEEGANPDKCVIIPNGIRLERFKNGAVTKKEGQRIIGFAGRVVPIKDVKTFIRACKKIREEINDVKILIMGPTDEDEDYYQECVFLVQSQGLSDAIEFKGKVDLTKYYPQLDVLVLTSISEAQPIVALEAQACGVPVVATDVGDCTGLIYGKSPEDRWLGPSGIITPICDAHATAEAVLRILKDKSLHSKMARAGKERVVRFYQQEDVVASYQSFYSEFAEKIQWQA